MNHKAEYEAIKKQIAECEQELKNRCIECSNFNKKKGECLKHGIMFTIPFPTLLTASPILLQNDIMI